MTHLLSDLPALSDYVLPLKALGYTTYEQLVAAAQAAGPELSAYLGIPSLNQLFARVTTPPAAISADLQEQLDALPCALGVVLDQVPRLTSAPAFTPPVTLLPQDNLIPQLPEIRIKASGEPASRFCRPCRTE